MKMIAVYCNFNARLLTIHLVFTQYLQCRTTTNIDHTLVETQNNNAVCNYT